MQLGKKAAVNNGSKWSAEIAWAGKGNQWNHIQGAECISTSSPQQAECKAILQSIKFGKRHESSVTIKPDCLEAIQVIHNPIIASIDIFHLIRDIRSSAN